MDIVDKNILLQLTIQSVLVLATSQPVWALDYITLQRDNQRLHVSGRSIVEDAEGGILLQSPDGFLWVVESEELVKRTTDTKPFEPLSPSELSAKLLREFPTQFEIHTTAHYLVCHNTSKDYAKWCGSLYERLYRAFHNYWKRRGFELHAPKFPLVALVFRDKASYENYASGELGAAVRSVIGYYNLRTNRVVMYDLTGLESLKTGRNNDLSVSEINLLLAQPKIERTVATVIHEATHQIAFNCGLHQRYAEIPLWLSEGIAMYFETPELKSSRGWRNIGKVNRVRLHEFQLGFPQRPDNSLTSLVTSDQRFQNRDQSLGAYPESWALVYFLIRNRPTDFVRYLHILSKKKPLAVDGHDKRLTEFRAAFGQDLKNLDATFVRQINRIR